MPIMFPGTLFPLFMIVIVVIALIASTVARATSRRRVTRALIKECNQCRYNYQYRYSETCWKHSNKKKGVRAGIKTFAILFAVAQGIVYVASTGTRVPGVTVADMSKVMGLESGKSYPLQIGRVLGGSTGEGHFTLGFGGVSVRPSSSLQIGFTTADGKYSILTLPVDRIKFDTSSGGESRVTIHLSNLSASGPDQRYKQGMVTEEAHSAIDGGFITYQRIASYPLTVADNVTLAKVVNPSVDYVDVKLTFDQYKAVLGTP